MVNTAILVAPDDAGRQPVFGVPAARRLALLCRRVGIGAVHVVEAGGALREVLGDLLEPGAFHRASGAEDAAAWLAGVDLPAGDPVLVARADGVLDRATLRGFLAGEEGAGGAGDGVLCLARPADLPRAIGRLWGRDVSPTAAGLPRVLGRDPGGVAAAEAALVDALGAQTAADDGFMARHFDRKISQALSRRLARTRITPNEITLVGVSIGLAGAYLLSLPHYAARVIGALLFLACIVVDGVDGEVARLALRESVFGHYLDVITDNLVHAAVFAGIAVGLYRGSGGILYLYALWALLGGFVLCLIAVYQCILRRTPEELARSPRAVRLLAFLSNRDFAYLVAVLAIVGKLHWFLLGAAAGSYVFAAVLWEVSRRERRRPAAESL